jgi:HlyD family secretion protein
MRRTIIVVIGVVAVLAIAAVVFFTSNPPAFLATSPINLETTQVEIGSIRGSISATGTLNSNQSAQLAWKTSGFVGQLFVQSGDLVQTGDVLAELDPSSLSPGDILARAELVSAQRALDDLLDSQVQAAAALQAVEDAQDALADARNPDLAQAAALQEIAEAKKAVEEADRKFRILTAPVRQSALDQAQANLVLAEKALNDNQDLIDRIEKKKNKAESKYKPWESRRRYKKILEGLEIQRIQLQISFENSQQKYQDLQSPPNPNDVAVAEANLMDAQAQLLAAVRDWERIKDGTSLGDIALLEAQLQDAQREWQRLKDGPDPQDIIAAQARLTAAQAAIQQVHLLAPFNGTITDVVNKPNDQVSAGTPAFRLDDLSHYWVEVGVSEIDINQVEVGQPAFLTFDAILGKEYQGQVVEVSPVGNEADGVVTFIVKVELVDPDQDVRPGMTVEVVIIVDEVDEAVLVPNHALRSLEGKRIVYVLQEGGDLELVEVAIGVSSGKFSQVLAGDITPGDLIVTNPDEL